jgi:hypothetical protein
VPAAAAQGGGCAAKSTIIHTMRVEKTCPDCAESVLAQARVCRFCGYRFASAPRASPRQWVFRRPIDTRSLPEFLLDWGLALEDSEAVAFFGLCELEQSAGFLLVTNQRAAFFTQRGARKLLDWPLEGLRHVEIRGRGRRACIVLSSEAGQVTVRHFASASALREVADTLAVSSPPQPASEPSRDGPGIS